MQFRRNLSQEEPKKGKHREEAKLCTHGKRGTVSARRVAAAVLRVAIGRGGSLGNRCGCSGASGYLRSILLT